MSNKQVLPTKNWAIAGICIAIILVGSFMLFSSVGIKIVAGIIISCMPAYVILKQKFERDESLVFAVFVSIGLIPLGVYLTNELFSISLTSGALLIWTIGIVIGGALHWRKKNNRLK